MKIRCPRCEKKLSIADKYAGMAIRCPACNRGFNVPKMEQAVAVGGVSELDLSTLAAAEARTSQLTEEEMAAIDGTAEEQLDPGIRICPHCQSKVKAIDPTVEALCSHCWKAIPALNAGGGLGGKKIKGQKEINAFGRGGFYMEIGNAITFPLSAVGSIITAALVAFGAAVIPVVLMTLAANTVSLSNVGTAQENDAVDLGNIPGTLTLIFFAEVIYFSAVGVHVFFDVVRSTGVGEDAAPALTWSPNALGKSVSAFLILYVYLTALNYVLIFLTLGDPVELLSKVAETGDMTPLLAAVVPYIAGLVLIAFLIPMYLIGISLGSIGQALNPVNVFKSVGRTHVHYLFLVLIVLLLGVLFQFGFFAILFGWFIPQVSTMIAGSGEGKLGTVTLAMLAWGVVMGAFFYGIYVLARLHGLFARTFRKKLAFGTK